MKKKHNWSQSCICCSQNSSNVEIHGNSTGWGWSYMPEWQSLCWNMVAPFSAMSCFTISMMGNRVSHPSVKTWGPQTSMFLVPKPKCLHQVYTTKLESCLPKTRPTALFVHCPHSVHRGNPAPVGMVAIPLFMSGLWCANWVVRFPWISSITSSICPLSSSIAIRDS